MTRFLVLLGLCVTVVLSNPRSSESQERFRFVPWLGFNEVDLRTQSRTVHEPGSLVVVEISLFQFRFCFSKMPGGEGCQPGQGGPGLPPDTQLISSRETVASVEFVDSVPVIRLNRPGNTTLQLRETGEKKRLLATYRLIVSSVDAGTRCSSIFVITGSITDCSGRCFPGAETNCPPGPGTSPSCVRISERISDGRCNSGRRLDDGRRDINLACSTFAFDGGDCVVDEDPSLIIRDCCGCVVVASTDVDTGVDTGPFERMRQALNDGMCNDMTQDINLNCPVFAIDKGACSDPPRVLGCSPCR